MKAFISQRVVITLVFLLAVACFAAGVWWFAYSSALDRVEDRGRADLALAADRLTGQLQRFRELAVILTDHPSLSDLVLYGRGDPKMASGLLLEVADKTGSLNIQLVRDDVLLASARPTGLPVGAKAAIDRAMNGALGVAPFVDQEGARHFVYAAPVFEPAGVARGAILVTANVSAIEWNWPAGPAPVFFTDAEGTVFVANRSELVLTSQTASASSGFPEFTERHVDGHSVWKIEGERYLPLRSLHVTQMIPVIYMKGEILMDLGPARNVAFLEAAVTAALCLVFGAMLFVATERRRSLSDRLEVEGAANAKLERRVVARTKELSTLNSSLRREIKERQEAEEALRKAQADLVQASKLSALGQMSAGISHELNQPLMAIRSFAENGEIFLARGDTELATDNLSRISELSRRMGRIIKNLRSFARQEIEPIGNVDLGNVVDAVLELAGSRISSSGVQVNWQKPTQQVFVRGGDVRLQQIMMNLVSNALDAMVDSSPKQLSISILRNGATIQLSVRDSGEGISDTAKIFDPFYSTKEVGRSEGMGLGLSISYGLVKSFGGEIRGRNHSGGGAEFVVELPVARMEQAA